MNKKLTYKLTIRSFVTLMLLGFLMASVQTLIDFQERKKLLEDNINAALESTRKPAANAVFLLDPYLAEQVVESLTSYPFFSMIEIVDDKENVLADFTKTDTSAEFSLLSFFIEPTTDKRLSFEFNGVSGLLDVTIDNYIAFDGVIDRALTTFMIALAGYFTLSAMLAVMYHYTLAAPLRSLSNRFQQVNTRYIDEQKIEKMRGHEDDEFDAIITSANEMLRRIAIEQLQSSKRGQRFRLILDTVPSLVFSIDHEYKFVFANQSTAQFYGRSIFELKGTMATDVLSPTDKLLFKEVLNFQQSEELNRSVEVIMYAYNLKRHVMEVSFAKFRTYEGENVLVVATDVTSRVDAEDKIEALAYYDSLTKLPNRNRVYEILLKQRNSVSESRNTFNAVIIADLDEFKRINDTLSHSVGDQLIIIVANRLKAEFNDIGDIARLGADEFFCHSNQLSNDYDLSCKIAYEVAEKFRRNINQPIDIGQNQYNLSASVGVVVYNPAESNVHEVLQYADTAMYQSKKAGKNCSTLFVQNMALEAASLLTLEQDIIFAIDNNQFFFELQPLVDSTTGNLVSAEALIRWQRNGKIVYPCGFIAFLESSSLIVSVGDKMLNMVCEYIVDLRQQNKLPSKFRIAVNISGKQLSRPDFIDRVTDILREHGVPGSIFEFEITESVALGNMEDTIQKMSKLRKMGITFSLDDFGTGYSSLSHLKDLPVDKLKIDRSFINDITVDKQDENMVLSILQLANNLGLVSVAEGVETKSQVDWLKKHGNLLLQGYYFNKPMVQDKFTDTYFN